MNSEKASGVGGGRRAVWTSVSPAVKMGAWERGNLTDP